MENPLSSCKNDCEMKNILPCKNRQEFRVWLLNNCQNEKECWVEITRGKPKDDTHFWYLDAVEEAICFGWIDNVWKHVEEKMLTRFSPRQKKSPWTELNKERARRLIKLDLMTEYGTKILPNLQKDFEIDADIKKALQENGAWQTFLSFPPLYQKIRAYNVAFYKNWNKTTYEKSLAHLIEETKKGKLFGEWNDYGRLLDY